MEKKLEMLALQIAAHRILLAGLLARSVSSDDDLTRLRAHLLDGQMAASVRATRPEAGEVFFDEMAHILRLSAAASGPDEQLKRTTAGTD